ncbi:cytochrome P450 [Leptodontidium sp. 2 PMI_412]|nr:cytochrome P450 [Leptodontidium sp. 2 PMI_412]
MISEILSFLLAYRNIFLTLLLIQLLYNKYGHSISKYPGPFLASFTDWWRFYNIAVNNHVLPMLDLHRKYGKTVKYGPNMQSFSEPRAIHNIYVGFDSVTKESWDARLEITMRVGRYGSADEVQLNYYAMDDTYIQGVRHHTMFSTRDEKLHARMRRVSLGYTHPADTSRVGPTFSMTSITGLEKYVDDTISYIITTISARFVDNPSAKPLNLLTWIQYFAFDVLGQLMWSEQHGCVEKRADVDSIIGNPPMILSSTLGLVDTAYAIFPYAEKQMKQTQGCIHKNADCERSNADLLDRMLVLQQKNPDLLTDTEIKKICAMLVFVGSDTTAITISTLLYHLIRNPSSYTTLQSEIDTAMPTTSIPFSCAQSLPCLDACIKDIFRLHPATGFNLERVVPAGGRKVVGESIPGREYCVLGDL